MQEVDRKKELSMALGRVITKLRKESNLSARAVAYGVNLSKTTLLLAEQGKLDPQLSTFCRISDAFYKQPNELFSLVMSELPQNWFQND